MKSVMNHNFALVPDVSLPRSKFNLSRGYKTTFDGDYLIPVGVREVLPGDTVSMRMNFFARLNTPLFPCMDNIFLDSFFFFIPNRLVWTNWVKMCGEQLDPDDTTNYTVPVLDIASEPCLSGFVASTLYDYMGLPTEIAAIEGINALPIRGYNLCWNTWFRDQNLQDPVTVDTGDADSDPGDYVLLKRGKRYDYFTSALPWAQKNNTGSAVTLPLGTSATVEATTGDGATKMYVRKISDDTATTSQNITVDAGGDLNSGVDAYLDPNGRLYADLSTATAATVNELRQAIMVQALYEKDARGGTRYIELVKSHFGVTSSDARLQRPEFLGGGSTPININSVANTTAIDSANDPGSKDRYPGDLAGFGTCSGVHSFFKSFEEHGILLYLVAARGDLTYQQGLERMWSRSNRLSYYWPALAHLGEQAILNKEIYCKSDGNDNLVFGYQGRFDEYRFGMSQITGQFRSNFATPLDGWHLSEEFGALPTLENFIQQNTPFDRICAVTSAPHFKFDAFFDEQWTRCMPVYSIPGMGARL